VSVNPPAVTPPDVSRQQLIDGFHRIGLRAGQVALVHSGLRPFGNVGGGAETVVDALLEVLGPRGTLVVPTFTFTHEAATAAGEKPLIDPATDPSEMGAISEAARRRRDARRTTAYRHSFAAIGRRAELLASVDPGLAPFDFRSAFGVLLALDAQVALLGVTYARSTSHHFAEWVADVPYRHQLEREVRLRRPDGTVVETTMGDYQPRPSADGSYYGSRVTDFNKLGLMLERSGRVGVTSIGNAIVRRFAMRDLIARASVEAEQDYNVFRTEEGQKSHVTGLPDGVFVFSHEVRDGAGRPEIHFWNVVNARAIPGFREDWRVVQPVVPEHAS
jgi:aminoglycoside 3-N-acetyltransferase